MNNADMMGRDDMVILGCDIGNQNAYVCGFGPGMEQPVRLIPPSKPRGVNTDVFVRPDGSVLLLEEARQKHAREVRSHPAGKLNAVKQMLDSPRVAEADGSRLPLEEAYAAVVAGVLRQAADYAASIGRHPGFRICLTYPAKYDENEQLRQKIISTVHGMNVGGQQVQVLHCLPEPAAAALDYLHFRQHHPDPRIRLDDTGFTVIVYDLGHGTLDVALVTASSIGQPYELHAQDSRLDVGGRLFNERMTGLLKRALAEAGYPPAVSGSWSEVDEDQLFTLATQMREGLTSQTVMNGSFRSSLMEERGRAYPVTVTREEYEAEIEGELSAADQLLEDMFLRAQELGLTVDAVVMTGGASRTPLVYRLIREYVDAMVEEGLLKEPVTIGVPVLTAGGAGVENRAEPYCCSTAVAMGAARYGVMVERLMRQTARWDYHLRFPDGECRLAFPAASRLPASSDWFSYMAGSDEQKFEPVRCPRDGNPAKDGYLLPAFFPALQYQQEVQLRLAMDTNRVLHLHVQHDKGREVELTSYHPVEERNGGRMHEGNGDLRAVPAVGGADGWPGQPDVL